MTEAAPIQDALTMYSDGSKTGVGALALPQGKTMTFQFRPGSPQVTECMTVLQALKLFYQPFNLFSDSQYVVNAVKRLEVAASIRSSSTVSNVLAQIQHAILSRRHPFFIRHMRAHTLLPGPMSEGNACADAATRPLACVAPQPAECYAGEA